MDFSARDGTWWFAYVEAVPVLLKHRRRPQSLLPPRQLRFDSATESRVIAPVPAGAPFLPEERLRGLLARSTPLLPPDPAATRPADARARARQLGERAAIAAAKSRERWKWAVRGRHTLGARIEGAMTNAVDRAAALVAAFFRRARTRL